MPSHSPVHPIPSNRPFNLNQNSSPRNTPIYSNRRHNNSNSKTLRSGFSHRELEDRQDFNNNQFRSYPVPYYRDNRNDDNYYNGRSNVVASLSNSSRSSFNNDDMRFRHNNNQQQQQQRYFNPPLHNKNFNHYGSFDQKRVEHRSVGLDNKNAWSAETTETYQTEGIVCWAEDLIGLVLCERNIEHGNLHFYFDGRTVIDGNTLAILKRDGQVSLEPGVRIEFTASFVMPEVARPVEHHFVHISHINVVSLVPEYEEAHLQLVYYGDTVTTSKIAMDASGEKAILPSFLLLIEELKLAIQNNSPRIPINEQSARFFKKAFIQGRTLTSRVIRTPRWVGDVIGSRLNAKRIVLFIDTLDELRSGCGTIIQHIPNLYAIIQSDEGSEDIFYSTVHLERSEKEMVAMGRRVSFTFVRSLPQMTYKWKALNVRPLSTSCPGYIPRIRVQPEPLLIDINGSNDSSVETPLVNLLTDSDSFTSTSSDVHTLSSSILQDLTEIKWDYRDELNDIWNSPHNPAPQTIPTSFPAISNAFNVEPFTTFPTTIIPSSSEESCYFSCDEEEKRCNFAVLLKERRFRDEVHCHKTVDPDDLRIKTTALKKRDRDIDLELKESLHKVEEKKVKPPKRVKIKAPKPPKKVKQEKVEKVESEEQIPFVHTYLDNSAPNIRVIGLYDDIGLVFEEELLMKMQKSEEFKKNPSIYPTERVRDMKKQWFVRKSPRVLPVVVVAEFIENRDYEEDMQDVKLHSLKETVVRRNSNRKVSEKDQNLKRDTLRETKKEILTESTPINPPPSKVSDLIKNDTIYGSFFDCLLKKNT